MLRLDHQTQKEEERWSEYGDRESPGRTRSVEVLTPESGPPGRHPVGVLGRAVLDAVRLGEVGGHNVLPVVGLRSVEGRGADGQARGVDSRTGSRTLGGSPRREDGRDGVGPGLYPLLPVRRDDETGRSRVPVPPRWLTGSPYTQETPEALGPRPHEGGVRVDEGTSCLPLSRRGVVDGDWGRKGLVSDVFPSLSCFRCPSGPERDEVGGRRVRRGVDRTTSLCRRGDSTRRSSRGPLPIISMIS